MREYLHTSGISETIPIMNGETWNVSNGLGQIVERWTVIHIDTSDKSQKKFTAKVKDYGRF